MQLFEVKKDIAKIEYNPSENNLFPSDFLLIEDGEQKIVAQILNIYSAENTTKNIAEIKFSLSIDEDENLSYYNGYTPSNDSIVIYVKPEEIIALMKDSENNIYFGNLSNHKECFVNTSLSVLNEKLYIQSDRDDKTKILLQNIISELYSKKKKTVIIDFDGRYNSIVNVERLTVTEDYKLPLNILAFNTILNEDTSICTNEDKSTIENIVFELKNYISTLEDKFIPFSVFKSVIDDELNTNSETGIRYLDKKLQEYLQQGIFAEDKYQFNNISDKLLQNNILIIEASNLDEKWHKLLTDTIVNSIDIQVYFAVCLNDTKTDADIISMIFNSEKIIPIVSSHYDSKFRDKLKQLCKNNILLKPAHNIGDNEVYSNLLNKINSSEFILYGNSSLYLPLIVELQSFDNSTEQEVIQNEIKQDVDKFLSQESKPIADENFIDESQTDNINDVTDEDLDFLDEINIDKDEKETNYGIFEPINSSEQNKIENVSEETKVVADIDNVDAKEPEITSDNEIDQEENEIIVSVENDELKEDIQNNELEKIDIEVEETDDVRQIINVDKNDENDNENTLIQDINTEENIQENNTETVISNDEKITADTSIQINEAEDETESDNVNTENTKTENQFNDSNKKLTIYETDNSNNEYTQNDIPFKIGDKVYHPKHGNGVIEGFANYSNKILFCQIDFENVGRRILDPRISGLEKIS